jgi:hypothetical protein
MAYPAPRIIMTKIAVIMVLVFIVFSLTCLHKRCVRRVMLQYT